MRRSEFSGCLTANARLIVPFYDLDPTGVVWHGRYFQYFELARHALLESIGYSYLAMQDTGVFWPVADASVRYLRPLTLDREVIVLACLREWELRIVVEYRIEDAAGTLYTRGRTVQAPVDSQTFALTLGSPQLLLDRVREKRREQGLPTS